MLFEVGSSIVMLGVAGAAFFKQKGPATNDAAKIQTIFNNVGWGGKNGETIRLHRKTKIEGGVEYVYQIPLGFDRKKVENNRHILEDGLNVKHTYLEFDKSELLKLKWDKTVIRQIKEILTAEKKARKEIDLSFDGMLKIQVYNKAMENKIDWSDNMLNKNSWAVTIGCQRNGFIKHDFDKRKHLIVAGATGGGKSVVIKAIITALIMQQPENVTFSLIDLKGGPAFARFKDCKQVVNFGVDGKEALEILKDVQGKMNDDYKKIVDGGFEDVGEAGITKRHFLIVDEAADLADQAAHMDILTDIVRKGRGAGYYLIYATQYPSAQAIPMQIKRNIPARLCFVLDSQSASMTVLDAPGAEDLPEIPGRGIYKDTKQTTLQAPYMSNTQIKERIASHIIIKANKEDQHGKDSSETTASGKHSIVFEKVGLPNEGTNTKNTQFKRGSKRK